MTMSLRITRFALLSALLLLGAISATASDWLKVVKPSYPREPRKEGVEGAVKLRVRLTSDGSVTGSSVIKSSGSSSLDTAGQTAVLEWKMKPEAVHPTDLTRGRDVVVEFREETAVGAVYPTRVFAAFENYHSAANWVYAPFPDYPASDRVMHHTGTVWVAGLVGLDGRIEDPRIVQSSGHSSLDDAALSAFRVWHAHKELAGKTVKQPIRFEMGRH